jgi:hypothetical protein
LHIYLNRLDTAVSLLPTPSDRTKSLESEEFANAHSTDSLLNG